MGDSFVADCRQGNELGCGVGKCLVYNELVMFTSLPLHIWRSFCLVSYGVDIRLGGLK